MRSWSPIFLEGEGDKYSLDVLGCLKYAVRMKESFSFTHGNGLNSTFDLGIWKTTVKKAMLTFKGLLMGLICEKAYHVYLGFHTERNIELTDPSL